jgi:stage III sporulation protein SpoIIIAA
LHEQLHRISAIRNRADAIIGLTMRVGRHVNGNASMIADLLFHDDASILFLGEPGAGKTTVVREVTRLLAERSNVLIVDTSNEIAGDGDVPHPCVGHARRMQVRSLEEQGDVMIEGVQNHTPEVMVIDEIGRPSEVEAARTVKQRGVRIIASAHGDLRKLLKNKQLRGLIGGVELVTLGDAQAKEEARKRGSHPGASIDKIKAQRAGPPVFDIIVELRRGEPNEWRIVNPCAKAVDMILEGSHYLSQRRTRDPATGEFFLELERA